MTTPTDAQLSAIAAAFDTFSRRFKMAGSMATDPPLNEVDKQMLYYVAEHHDCSPTDVARFLSVPATTLTSVADRLVKKKLLERHRAETDRRAVVLHLTDSGKQLVDTLMAAYMDMYRTLLEPLAPTEQDEFIRIITKIAQNE